MSPAFFCPLLFLVHTFVTNQFPLLLLSLALFSMVLRISAPNLQHLLALLPMNNCRLELGRYGCRLMLKNIQQLLRHTERYTTFRFLTQNMVYLAIPVFRGDAMPLISMI